ncbi:MAG: hypothetical protein QXS54_12245 [Candidatus Methanomethylicaceae archaeon]
MVKTPETGEFEFRIMNGIQDEKIPNFDSIREKFIDEIRPWLLWDQDKPSDRAVVYVYGVVKPVKVLVFRFRGESARITFGNFQNNEFVPYYTWTGKVIERTSEREIVERDIEKYWLFERGLILEYKLSPLKTLELFGDSAESTLKLPANGFVLTKADKGRYLRVLDEKTDLVQLRRATYLLQPGWLKVRNELYQGDLRTTLVITYKKQSKLLPVTMRTEVKNWRGALKLPNGKPLIAGEVEYRSIQAMSATLEMLRDQPEIPNWIEIFCEEGNGHVIARFKDFAEYAKYHEGEVKFRDRGKFGTVFGTKALIMKDSVLLLTQDNRLIHNELLNESDLSQIKSL